MNYHLFVSLWNNCTYEQNNLWPLYQWKGEGGGINGGWVVGGGRGNSGLVLSLSAWQTKGTPRYVGFLRSCFSLLDKRDCPKTSFPFFLSWQKLEKPQYYFLFFPPLNTHTHTHTHIHTHRSIWQKGITWIVNYCLFVSWNSSIYMNKTISGHYIHGRGWS